MACGIAGGEIELVGIRPEHLEIVVMKLCEMGMRVSPTTDGLVGARPAAAARGRHRDAAAPGFRDRLHAARGRADDGRRRQRDRHRERLRRPLPVRRRARPHGRRRAHRGPPRDRPRRRPAFGRAGAGLRRAGRGRARARRARRRRRDDGARLRARRPGLLRPRRPQLRALGADVERLPERGATEDSAYRSTTSMALESREQARY